MKKYNFRKSFVFVLIFLFVGITIKPGIIADISIDSDTTETVEISLQICKGNFAYDHKVAMSVEQSEKLEKLISRTKSKLDAAETIEDTSNIFNETVFSLYERSMLPNGMSIEDAQQLVNGKYRHFGINKLLEIMISRYMGADSMKENLFCLIAGLTSTTTFVGPLGLLLVLQFSNDDIHRLVLLSSILKVLSPIAFGNTIYLGSYFRFDFQIDRSPSNGWIHTIGLNGTKKWEGKFWGNLPDSLTIFILNELGGYWRYPGVLGFTGIKIPILGQGYFYLGTALWVKVGDSRP